MFFSISLVSKVIHSDMLQSSESFQSSSFTLHYLPRYAIDSALIIPLSFLEKKKKKKDNKECLCFILQVFTAFQSQNKVIYTHTNTEGHQRLFWDLWIFCISSHCTGAFIFRRKWETCTCPTPDERKGSLICLFPAKVEDTANVKMLFLQPSLQKQSTSNQWNLVQFINQLLHLGINVWRWSNKRMLWHNYCRKGGKRFLTKVQWQKS